MYSGISQLDHASSGYVHGYNIIINILLQIIPQLGLGITSLYSHRSYEGAAVYLIPSTKLIPLI